MKRDIVLYCTSIGKSVWTSLPHVIVSPDPELPTTLPQTVCARFRWPEMMMTKLFVVCFFFFFPIFFGLAHLVEPRSILPSPLGSDPQTTQHCWQDNVFFLLSRSSHSWSIWLGPACPFVYTHVVLQTAAPTRPRTSSIRARKAGKILVAANEEENPHRPTGPVNSCIF